MNISNYLYQNWDLLAVGIVIVMTVIMGFVVYFSNSQTKVNRVFLGLSIFIALWGVCNYLSYQSQLAINAFFLLRLTVFTVTWLLLLFLLFALLFLKIKPKTSKIIETILYAWTFIVSILTLTPLVFEKVHGISSSGIITSVVNGPLLPVFGITTTLYAVSGIVLLIIGVFRSEEKSRKNFLLIIFGVIIMFLAIMISNFILPVVFGDSSYIPISVLFVFPFIVFTSYAIARGNIFNVKIIGAEIFMSVLLILALFQFMQASDLYTILQRGSVFLSLLAVGVLLLKSVMKEVEQRQQLQILLEERESLEHLINHKVKGSFTRSKFVFAEMLTGSFGPLTDKMREMAQGGLDANNSGIKTVDLILNSFNLQSGTVKFDLKEIDFKNIVLEVVKEKKGPAEQKGLAFEVNTEEGEFKLIGDEIWLKEAVSNLVENSVRYTLHGSIKISLKREGKKAVLKVEDTGVGITPEDKVNLFKQGGRGKESVRINTDSTGYGLYSVKLILDAHKGEVMAESLGKDQGSAFYIKLDLVK